MRSPRTHPRLAALGLGLLLTLFWAVLHRRVEDPLQIGDINVYAAYGEAMVHGFMPYRDFPLNYPPGSLPMFWLPTIGSNYLHTFELLAWACGAGTVALVALTLGRLTDSPRRLYAGVAFAALGPVALGTVTLVRYDTFVALLTAGALLCLVIGRPRLGIGLLALGTAAKLYPLVVLPIALLYVRRTRGMREAVIGFGVFAAVLALVVVPFLVAAPGELLEAFRRQAGRDLQMESLGSGVLILAYHLGIYTPEPTNSLQSFSLGGSVADLTGSVIGVLQGLAVLVVWVVYARVREREAEPQRMLLAAAAVVTAFVAFGKVLSPQYLLWLIPLIALLAGRKGIAAGVLLGISLLLTRDLFEFHYADVITFRPLSLIVTVRDFLLVALFGVLLVELRGGFRHANIRSPWWSVSSTPASSSKRR